MNRVLSLPVRKAAIQPMAGDVHVNRPLTNISLAYMQNPEGFVADRIFPTVPVAKQSDTYFTFDRGRMNKAQMRKRAPGTESAGGSYSVSEAPPYFAHIWALHDDIADPVRANVDDPLNLDRQTTMFLAQQALLSKELNFRDLHFVQGVWGTDWEGITGSSGTATQVQRWDEAASTPIEDVRRAKRTIQESTGYRPNKAVMGREVFDTLVDHPDIVARVDQSSSPGNPAVVNKQALAALFELDAIEVMDAIENTAQEGATNAHAFIGGKSMLLCYVAPTPGLMIPSAGYTFSWTGYAGASALGGRVKKFRMEHLNSDRIEQELAFDQKQVGADLGLFIRTLIN